MHRSRSKSLWSLQSRVWRHSALSITMPIRQMTPQRPCARELVWLEQWSVSEGNFRSRAVRISQNKPHKTYIKRRCVVIIGRLNRRQIGYIDKSSHVKRAIRRRNSGRDMVRTHNTCLKRQGGECGGHDRCVGERPARSTLDFCSRTGGVSLRRHTATNRCRYR